MLTVHSTFCARRCLSQTASLLSGHNKWSKIKQKKGINDMQKSAAYGRIGRDIIVAIRTGGSADPNLNTTLANILKKAKTAGIPKENIEKAMTRATGGTGKDASTHVVFEAMVSGNVAVIIECMTDNGNRTIHKLRGILSEYSGRFAPVRFLFDKVGRIRVSVPRKEGAEDRDSIIERIWEASVAAGGDDFEVFEDSDTVQFTCPAEALEAVTAAVSGTELCDEVLSSEWIYRARDAPEEGSVDDELATNISGLLESLEENEDCVRVWTTIDSYIRSDDE